MENIHSKPSYVLKNDQVELAVTRLGGHMAPVTFYSGTKKSVQPYYISPWQDEKDGIDEPVLRPLRGDLFCMPFGADNKVGREKHEIHGESATMAWEPLAISNRGSVSELSLQMKTRVRPGTITKRLMLVEGHNVVYCRHELEGYKGSMCLGHHATLAIPPDPGSLLFSSSPIRFGITSPGAPGPYAGGEYYCLPAGVRFSKLNKVPTIWRERPFSDRSTFPAEEGFTDILAIFPRKQQGIVWNAASFAKQGFVWFSLKDPAMLPSTVLWMSNRGRHGAPWNGRNRCLGIEDVCAYFAEGLGPSIKPNMLNEQGIPTALELSPKNPTAINYIQGVTRVPRGFDRVADIAFKNEKIELTAESGKTVTSPVHYSFLKSGTIEPE